MKKLLLGFLLALMFSSLLVATENVNSNSNYSLSKTQVLDDLWMDANRMNGVFRNSGVWYYDYATGDWGLEWPKGSHLSPIFAGGQWIAARVEGQIRVAGVIHSATEFQPGNIISPGVAGNARDAAYQWYVLKPGGVGDWANWPVDQGAPVDADGNPTLIGDMTAFSVWNDLADHVEFGTEKLGAEVRQLVWQFNRADALGDMTFIKWQIVNKSGAAWDSTNLSIWQDPDLGNATDDFVGCDPTLGLGYCYNADNDDQNYGAAPPATGIDFFQGPLIPSPGDQVILPDGTVIPDVKMLGMTSFIYYNNNDSNTGNPQTAQDVWNYQRGYWRDGSPILDPNGVKSPFMFSGDPATATGWLDSNEDDRRFLMTVGPFTMPAWVDQNGDGQPQLGEPGVQEIVAAVMVARSSDNLASVTKLKLIDDLAQKAYDLNFILATAPASPVVNVSEDANKVVLTWDETSELNADGSPYESEDPIIKEALGDTVILDNQVKVVDDATYNFYGYSVYQYSDAGGADPVLLQAWNNGGTQDAVPYEDVRHIILTTNKHSMVGTVGDPLINGKTYYFGVVAEGYCEFGAPTVFQSPTTVLEVTPQIDPGLRLASTEGDTLEVVHNVTVGLPSAGNVIPIVIDPSAVTGHFYRVTFNADATWNILRCADNTFAANVDTVLKNQSNQEGTDAYTVVDGLLVKVLGAANDFVNFQVVSNASGPLDPPVMGCFAFNSNGFPMLIDYDYQPVLNDDGTPVDRPAGQQVGGGAFGIHTGMNAPDMDAGYEFFLGRVTQGGARWPVIIPNDFEIRFTERGGKAFIPNAFSTGEDGGTLIDVPFELWNIGIITDPNDDFRMFPYILDDDNNQTFNLLTQASIDAAGDWSTGYADHTVSGGANDPFTDWFYWVIPENTAPGEVGYEALVSKIQAEGNAYVYLDGTNGDALRRMVFVNWNGGDIVAGVYNQNMPETGTVFRILTAKPNTPNDTYDFQAPVTTKALADLQSDLENANVVPNPYLGYHSGEMDAFDRWVQFTNLPNNVKIRIFDIAGNLVRTLEKNDEATLMQWDMKNAYEIPVASGIYICHIDAPSIGEKVLKLAIVAPNERLDTY